MVISSPRSTRSRKCPSLPFAWKALISSMFPTRSGKLHKAGLTDSLLLSRSTSSNGLDSLALPAGLGIDWHLRPREKMLTVFRLVLFRIRRIFKIIYAGIV
jgi:hypothetical protein